MDFVQANRETRRLLREIIRERKKEISQGDVKGATIREEFTESGSRDFLTFMLYEKSEGGNMWSEDDILGHVRSANCTHFIEVASPDSFNKLILTKHKLQLLNFMSAGHTTTADALTWALLTLCTHPSIQNRLRGEIYELIPHGQRATPKNLESLDYMSLFLKEVDRCFSPTVLVTRKPCHDNVVLCKTPIPASTTILMNPQSLQFNPAIWGPDAETTFDPSRHAVKDPRVELYPDSRDPYAIAAFSNGPRICIGKHFASLEMRSILVEILRSFEVIRGWDENGVRLKDGEIYEGDYHHGSDLFAGVKVMNTITLKPRDGVWVRFRPLDA